MDALTATEIDDRLYALSGHAVSVDINSWAVAGVRFWADFNVNAESDLVYSIAILDDGTVIASAGYGIHGVFTNPKPVQELFTKDNFLYFISECEQFNLRCIEFMCDQQDKENCVDHVNQNQDAIWDLVNNEVLSLFKVNA